MTRHEHKHLKDALAQLIISHTAMAEALRFLQQELQQIEHQFEIEDRANPALEQQATRSGPGDPYV